MKKHIFLFFCFLGLLSCKKEIKMSPNSESISKEIKTTIITVPSTADFIIRNTIKAIKDATYYNRYIVFVPRKLL